MNDEQKWIKYAVINPETGVVEAISTLTHLYVILDEDSDLDTEKKWVFRPSGKIKTAKDAGSFLEAPVCSLSLGFCSSPDRPDKPPKDMPGFEPASPAPAAVVDAAELEIKGMAPHEVYTACGVHEGPIEGWLFELVIDVPPEWADSLPKLFEVQVDNAKHPFKITPSTPVAMPAGMHTLQIIGPAPWGSKKLTVDVAPAPQQFDPSGINQITPE